MAGRPPLPDDEYYRYVRLVCENRYESGHLKRHRGLLKAWAAWLAHEFPVKYPVRVYQRKISGHGHCTQRGRKFVITIGRGLLLYVKAETLCHEWAHLYTWDHCGARDDYASHHPREFDLALGQIERAWHRTSPVDSGTL